MQRRPFLALAAALAAAVLALALLTLATRSWSFLAAAFLPGFFLVVLLAYGHDGPGARSAVPSPLRTLATRPAPPPRGAPFQHAGYTLYRRDLVASGGRLRTLYFFSRRTPRSGMPSAKPAGFHVGVNGRTGLPFLRRGDAPDDAGLTPAPAAEAYRPQCAALRNDGVQCRNSARGGSKYCGSHVGHQPRTAEGVVRRTDTVSKVARVDTATSFAGDGTARTTRGAQCQALTAAGGGRAQCKNTVRPGSQFCVAHQGYRSPTPRRVVEGRDSAPRVRGARDTLPSVRRSPA